ncbi:MAG: hydrogenase maturation protease [Cyanobacteriota bacterium]|nr:hydrogenase maturation protease [Cyanobacteriota bacterium]
MSPALLIGIGNPLRGDDGVGALLVEEVARERGGWSLPDLELEVVHQLTPELALAVAGADRVLFVDACIHPASAEPWIASLPPGGGQEQDVSPGSHGLAPITLVALARALYGWCGAAALLRVPARAFPHGSGLSAPLERALPAARELVRQWLRGR